MTSSEKLRQARNEGYDNGFKACQENAEQKIRAESLKIQRLTIISKIVESQALMAESNARLVMAAEKQL